MCGMSVRIKICGVKRVEDAKAAVTAGADAIGINFVPESSRYIGTVGRAQDLIVECGASALLWAGVFANPSDTLIDEAVGAGLRVIQLHGEEPAEFAESLRERLPTDVQLWKAFRISTADDLLQLADFSSCDAWVLDAKAAGTRGGSGQAFDWELLKSVPRTTPWVLAGGLNPDNVQDAVRRVRPEWVDVASGVESAPGIKDSAKIVRFIEEAKRGLKVR
jgi:phosphoribosylanthranilate isomerase